MRTGVFCTRECFFCTSGRFATGCWLARFGLFQACLWLLLPAPGWLLACSWLATDWLTLAPPFAAPCWLLTTMTKNQQLHMCNCSSCQAVQAKACLCTPTLLLLKQTHGSVANCNFRFTPAKQVPNFDTSTMTNLRFSG
jgi:hypothetical protein